MWIFARHALVPVGFPSDVDALLLEGSWPERRSSAIGRRRALDDMYTADDSWIDEQASRLAEEAIGSEQLAISAATTDADNAARSLPTLRAADLFALKLRYEFVKWLRLLDFVEQIAQAGPASKRVRVLLDHRERDAASDADYVALLRATSTTWRMTLDISFVNDADDIPLPSREFAIGSHQDRRGKNRSPGWRNTLGQVAKLLKPRTPPPNRAALFLGNPRILEPVFAEFIRRGEPAIWLREQFAPRSWLKGRLRGGDQRVIGMDVEAEVRCPGPSPAAAQSILGHPSDEHLAEETQFDAGHNGCLRSSEANSQSEPRLTFHGVDLLPCARQFVARLAAKRGGRLLAMAHSLNAVFNETRPRCLVLDEDATPVKRLAVRIAQSRGVRTFVVQHGAPRVRFGFAPLAADAILAWGDLSREQFERFGIPSDHIAVTGRADSLRQISGAIQAKKNHRILEVLLIATTPPRDHRPEPVGFHLTSAAYAELLESVFFVVAEIPHARLIVKRHPRCRDADRFERLAKSFPNLRCRLIQHGDVTRLARKSHIVLNCASGGGIEAAGAGCPVIELIPRGGRELLPAEPWGAAGAATSNQQLRLLLQRVLKAECETTSWQERADVEPIFAACGRRAARNAVNEILARCREPSISLKGTTAATKHPYSLSEPIRSASSAGNRQEDGWR